MSAPVLRCPVTSQGENPNLISQQPFSVARLSLHCWGSADGELLLSWSPRAAGRHVGRWFTLFMVLAFYVSLSSLRRMNLWDCALSLDPGFLSFEMSSIFL